MKILVAEDDKTTSEFLRKGLIENGHSVDCVVDGWETQRVRVLLIQENIPQTLKWDEHAVVDIME